MPIVALPDGREVEFPEGASPDLIQGALRKDFPQFFGGIDRAARKAELQAQQAAAREEGVTTSFSARAGAGIEQGLRTPEVMLRGGLDALQYYRALDAVTGSGDKYQQQNQAQLKAFNERDAYLARETQAIEGREGRNFVGDLVQGVARGVVELPPQLMAGAAGVARGAAVKASAMMGGAQGGLTQFAQDRGEGRSQLEAMPNAIASGLITAVTTRAFGDSGVEAVFRNEGVQGFRRRLVSVLREAGMEGAEEFTDQVQQDLLERATRNPGKPLGDTFYDTMQALGVGAVIGGGVNAPRLLPQRGPTALPDGREVIVNQETGTTEFAAPAPAAAQLSTLDSQPSTAVFRGRNGEDIRVDLGGATLEQAQAAIFRQQPGAEFVGTEAAASPPSPPPTVPPEAAPASQPSTPPLSTSPALRGEAAMETRPSAEMGLDRTQPSTLNPELSTDLADTTPAATGAKGRGKVFQPISVGRKVVSVTSRPDTSTWQVTSFADEYREQPSGHEGYKTLGEALKDVEYVGPENKQTVALGGHSMDAYFEASKQNPGATKAKPDNFIYASHRRPLSGLRVPDAVQSLSYKTKTGGMAGVVEVSRPLTLDEMVSFELAPINRAASDAYWKSVADAVHPGHENIRAGKESSSPIPAAKAKPTPAESGATAVEPSKSLRREFKADENGNTLLLTKSSKPEHAGMVKVTEISPDGTPGGDRIFKTEEDAIRSIQGESVPDGHKYPESWPVGGKAWKEVTKQKPPAQPGVATNTVAEQPTQPSGGQSTVAQPAPAAKAKRVRAGRSLMGRFNAETERMGPDILDFIIQSGGMLSKAGAKAKGVARWKLIASEYDDARTLAVPHHNLIYRGLRTPDKVAQAAYDKGLLSEASVPELWQAISDASRVRHAGNMNPSREEKFLQEEAAAAERWSKAIESGRLAVTTEQLVVGDVLAVEGVRVAVTERDPETGRLTLQDGREFETQFLEDDQIIYVEAWLEKTPAQAPLVDDWDTADPVPQPANPSAPDFSPAPAESVPEQQTRLAQEQAQREAAGAAQAQKDKLAELQAKPMEGTSGDFGQGDLPAAPDDLFAPPTPQAKTIAEAVATPDAVAATLLDEAADPVAAKLANIKADEADKFIEDFGEKIVGARKDLWATFKKRASEALPADAADITISSAFPEPDYEEALRQGVPMESLATFKALRDMVPAKPRQSWKLERWVELVRGLHALTSQLVQGQLNLTPERLAELVNNRAFGRIAQRVRLYRTLGYPAFTQAKDWSTVTGSYSVYRSQQFNPPKTITSAEHKGRSTDLEAEGSGPEAEAQVAELIRRKIAEAASQPKADDKVEFKLFKDRLTGDLFIGKKAVNGVVRLKTGFKSVKEARQFIADQQAELETQWAGLKAHPEYRRAINLPRQGPVRREGDVSPQLFQDAFGFRGVQFGNWVESDRRQVDLNEAFDALMDMAQALGVPPKALSLDGSLGLAFGARGTAGAKAHYEPGEVVINITKKSGPGSLAHEWFHAVDNYFARLDRTGKTEPKSLDAFATSNLRPAVNLRPEVAAAFKRVRGVLGLGTFSERSGKLDEARSKAYYGTTIEKAARAFEQYVVDRLALAGISNDYLVNLVKDESPALPTQAEMDGGIRQAFDALFEAVEVVPDVPTEVVDAKLKSWLDQHSGRPGMLYANPFLDPKFWQAVAVSGARMLRDLGQFTVTQAKWSAAMLKKFGQGIQQALAATWNRLMRLQTQQTNGVSAIGQGHLNQIEAASVNANIAEEQKPVYSEQDLAKGAPGLGIRLQPMSKQIAFLGGKALLGAKQKLDVTGALQAAAVKKQSDNLWQQLVASSAAGNPLTKWKLPAWLIGSPRARAFKQRVLHIAARLNATGRDAAGNFTFADFTMRAGTMSLATAKQSQLSVGDQFTVNDPLTGVTETLTLGPMITTPEGRVFHQLARPVDGATQAELYQHFAREYPEMIWFLDMFIDPALAGLRQTINGIEVPVFNRFAAAAMMADGNPNFSPLTAYTPDVLVTRSLVGAISGAWHKSGVRSPGRKYKSGTSREGGHVRDLLSGFNVRSWQMLQEKSRREWMQAVLKSATPIRQNQVPEGWVKLETGMEELWQAVRRLRNWKSPVYYQDATEKIELSSLEKVRSRLKYNEKLVDRDGTWFIEYTPFQETETRMTEKGAARLPAEMDYKHFFGEAAKLRGDQLMLPKALVKQLVRKYVAQVEHGTLYRMGAWLVRNSTQLFLTMPVTVVTNVLGNDLMTLQAATRRILSAVAGGKMQDLRFARELFVSETFKWFPGLRMLMDKQWRAAMTADVLPENLFADQTLLADLKVRLDEDPLTYLRQGEIGAAALNFMRYGNIDTRAKTRMAYAWLRAQAVTNARKAGLRGAALRASVDAYLAQPPVADVTRAVEIAGFELLNYADSPAWLENLASGNWKTGDMGDYARLLLPFPRYGYHFMAKTAREAAAVKLLLGKVPKGQRADAFADLITFILWPAGGLGLLAAAGIKGLGDDDDEVRKRVGTASIKTVDADGNVVSKPLPRDLITSNRINLSAWARGMGIGTDREEDAWWRVRSYQVISMAGAFLLAEEDARKFGAAEGAKTYLSAVKDLAADFFSVGLLAKVPLKVLGDLGNQRNERTFVDPYAAGVPTVAYVVDQTLDSFVPGTRQFDIAIKWMDPIARRRGASKTLGFDPTVWDAARVGHVTGLLDRLFAGADGTTASTLPPEGAIDRRTRSVPIPQEYTLQQRITELVGFNVRPIDRSRYEEALSPYATRN